MNVHLYTTVLKNETRILKIVRSLRAHGVFARIGVVGRNGPGLPAPDVRIDGPAQHGVPGLVNLFGIESPGLTSSMAIGDMVVACLAD